MNTGSIDASVYKLKRFTHSQDKDFVKALNIYMDNTDHNIITNTNEISYGVDFYNQKFSDSEFTVVGLYLNRVLIGFCQFMYFKEEKIVFIDYLVIDKMYRKNNTFYEFVDKIREYFSVMKYLVSYIIGEISLQGEGKEGEYPPKARNLIRLLKMSNFGVITVPYYQPMLGINNYETELEAKLMLYPVDEHQSIKKETFLIILKTIYFKHYERWYKIFLSEKDAREYSLHVHDLFKKINEKLKSIISIPLDSFNDITYDKLAKNPKRVPKKILYFLIGYIVMISLFGGISFFLRSTFNMTYKDQFYFLIFASIIYLAVLSIFSDKASNVLTKAIEKIIDKFT